MALSILNLVTAITLCILEVKIQALKRKKKTRSSSLIRPGQPEHPQRVCINKKFVAVGTLSNFPAPISLFLGWRYIPQKYLLETGRRFIPISRYVYLSAFSFYFPSISQ